jgi:hypothetical protein
MSDSKDIKPASPHDVEGDGPKQSGRISRDARGNAVWEWEMQTGVFGRDVSTQRLKKLEAHELAILETGAHKQLQSRKQVPSAPSSPATKPHVEGDANTQQPHTPEEHQLAIQETGLYKQVQQNKAASSGYPSSQAKPGVTATKSTGFNPYDSSSSGGSYRPPAPTSAEEKPRRRSIQSIVADQLAKNKKS